MCEFPIKSPRWIWTGLIAFVTCTFVVHLHAFTLDEECSTSCTGQYNIWKVFNTINKTCKCRSCSTCTEEHGLSVKCNTVITQKVSLECIKCVPGVNYSLDSNTEQCQPCQSTLCLENEIVNGKCTPGKDTTTCTGICEKGYSINSDRTRCVRLSIVGDNNTTLNVTDVPVHSMNTDKTKSMHLNTIGGDNTTLNSTDVPVQNSPSIKSESQSASDSLIVVKIVCPVLLFILIIAVVYWCYRQSHSRNQANELASELASVELGDSGATPSSTCTSNVIKDQETEALIQNPDEDNGQLQSPNFGEAFLSLNSSPQETPPTDSELTTTGIENETSEAVPTNNNACDTRRFHVEEPKRTTRGENLPAASPSLSTPSHTPLLSVRRFPRRPTMIGNLNHNVYAEVCKKLNLDIEGKDWRQIAGKMSYTVDQVKQFSKKEDPTDALLQDWSTNEGNDVGKLIEFCKMVKRGDVVETLEEALGIRCQSGVEEEGR